MNWYVKVLKQYVDFSGRARRTEFWMYYLFNVIAVIALIVIENLIGLGSFQGSAGATGASFSTSLGILSGLYALATLLPTLGVGVRRLHDTDRSGWWLLIGIVPIIGSIVLLVFFCLAGTPGTNKHGADPKAVAGAGAVY